MKKKILKIDIDGVLRDISPPVLHIYNEFFNKSNRIYTECDIIDFDYSKCFPDFNITFKEFFVKYKEEILLKSKPYKLVQSAMNKLYKKYYIKLVSAQYEENKDITDIWLKMYNIPYHELVYTFNKNEVKGDILLDDNIRNLEESNSIPICMCRNWNKKYKGKKVNNLFDFLNLIDYIC